MLFDSSLRKELSRGFGATLVVLVTVVMTMMLIRTLGQAARGNVGPSDVILIMGYTVLGQLPTILSLSLFIAVVGTLSRMYRDSEMAIWFAAGQGLARLLAPMLRFAAPIMLAVGVLALGVWPWSNRQIDELRQQYEQRGDIDRIAPGEFQESSDGSRVFFIDRETPGADAANNVFIATRDAGSETVTSAQSARLRMIDGERTVVLYNGERMQAANDGSQLRVSTFDEYRTRIDPGGSASRSDGGVRTIDSLQLLHADQPVLRAELGWRLGLMAAVLNFVVLGLAVASANPRAGRSTGLMFALLTFVVYYNLMTVGQSWVGAGRLSLASFMALLHGGVLALGLLVLAVRHNRWSPRMPWRRRSAA